MSFNVQSFVRLSSSANNVILTLQDGTLEGGPCFYSYISNVDNLATVTAPNYFGTQAPVLNVSDLIYIVGTDGNEFATVATVDENTNSVTVTLTTPATGDVSGPASSVALQPAVFDDTTGKSIQGEAFVVETASPVAVTPYGLYVANLGTLLTFNMPAVMPVGSRVTIVGTGAGGWLLQMNTGQTIHIGNQASTSGGSLASSNRYDVISLVCTVANTTFSVISSMGNITYA